MAVSLLFNSTVVGAGTGGTTQTVTVPFSGVSGGNCLAVLMGAGRTIGTTFDISATFDGTPMTLAVEASAALGGFGEGSASIFYLPVGTLASAAGNAVFTLSNTDGLAGRIATLAIYSDIQQVGPLRDTDATSFISSASSSTATVFTAVSDLVVDAITLNTNTSLTPNVAQTQLASIFNGIGNGDPTMHGASNKIATTTLESMQWSFGGSPFCHVAASFIEDATPAGPTITLVTPSGGAGQAVRPNDTNIGVDGTDFAPGGVTQLIMSPTTGPGDPLAQIQPISSVLNNSLNWDSVDLGAMDLGALYLFVRTDAGGPSEADSPPFPIVVSAPDIHWTSRVYTTTGATGPTVVVNDLPFKPVAAFIQMTGNTSVNTLQAGVSIGQCLVDKTTAMGIGLAAQASPIVTKRAQVIGTGALFIMDETADANPDVVVGTPALTDTGIDIDFTTNAANYTLAIGFLGGLTAQADLHEIQINDGSKSGLPFAPTVLMGISANMATGSGSDTTFARQSFGMAIGAGTDQFNQSTDMDSGSARNTEILQGTFLAQLNGQSNTWAMSITSLTSDGYTWSGSNPDGAFVLAMNTDTAALFLTQYQQVAAGNGATEDWPDSGIANPGILFTTCAGRIDTGPTGALGGRWSSGGCGPGEVQSGATGLFNPDSGVGGTDQIRSTVNMISNSSTPGILTIETRCIDFKQAPTVQYILNPTVGIRYNIFMAEEVSAGDEDGAFAQVW